MSAPGGHDRTSPPVRLTTGLPETVLPAEPPAVVAAPWPTRWPSRASGAATPCPTWCGPTRGSLDAWAALGSLARDDVEAYACFRVGYHRGLDALRGAGWKGSGLVRWSHEANRGFLRCLDGLRSAAGRHRRARRGGAVRPVPPPARPGVEPGLDRLPGLMPASAPRRPGPPAGPRGACPGAGGPRGRGHASAGCAGQEQSGTPAQQVTTWMDGGRADPASATVEVDARNVDLALAEHNRPAAIREVCDLLSNDAQTAIGNLPTPDDQLTDDLNTAYMDATAAGDDCYNGADGNARLLGRSAAERARASPCWPPPSQHIESVTGHDPDHRDHRTPGQQRPVQRRTRDRRPDGGADPTTSSTGCAGGCCGPCRPGCSSWAAGRATAGT